MPRPRISVEFRVCSMSLEFAGASGELPLILVMIRAHRSKQRRGYRRAPETVLVYLLAVDSRARAGERMHGKCFRQSRE